MSKNLDETLRLQSKKRKRMDTGDKRRETTRDCRGLGTSAKFFPVIKFILKNIRTVEIPWLRVRISAGMALKERQCTLKGQAWYVNVRGSVHWNFNFPTWRNLCT